MPGVLTRWDPYGELAEIRSRFDRMFEELRPETRWQSMPAIDVERADGNLIMRADVPGFTPEEISIEVEDEMLTISGKHEEEKEEKGKHFLRHERRFGSFSRSIALPAGVDASKISAQTHDGVLEVKVPLPDQQGEHKKVTITAKAAT
jgi:HSP20 family protein